MIIAELSQNHGGVKSILEKSVKEAARCGADFVKIQTFFADDLSDKWRNPSGSPERNGRSGRFKDYDENASDHYNYYKDLELDFKAHEFFVKLCEQEKVVPMTSVYSFKYAETLSNLGFKYIKIGSGDALKEELIRKYIIAGFKVILSTGGIPDLEKIPAFKNLECIMHCVSVYPHKTSEHGLSRMIEIARRFNKTDYGFSDHTNPVGITYNDASFLAIEMGAKYIERHFTVNERSNSKDGCVSLFPWQLKELCDYDKKFRQSKKIINVGENEIKKYYSRWKED